MMTKKFLSWKSEISYTMEHFVLANIRASLGLSGKGLLANAGDRGSIPDPGGSYMPQSD